MCVREKEREEERETLREIGIEKERESEGEKVSEKGRETERVRERGIIIRGAISTAIASYLVQHVFKIPCAEQYLMPLT